MKINIITKTFNNEWLIPYFFRHYDKYECNYYIWDNMSTDKTRHLLKQHSKVTLFDNISSVFDDYEHRHFKNTAFQQFKDCDFIFNIDFDEFIYSESLLESLNIFKVNDIKLIKTKGFQMFSDTLPTTNERIYDEIDKGIREPLYDKPIIFNPSIIPYFSFGAHYAESDTKIYDSDIKLLHYKFIGYQSIDELLKRNNKLSERNKEEGLSVWSVEKGNKYNPYEMYENLKLNSIKVI